MSELKEVYAYQSDEIESLVGKADGNSYYLKSEVDKVIAELENMLQTSDKRNDKLVSNASDMLTLKDKEAFELDCELRHQRYKRCLDKAKWCDERIARYQLQQAVQGILWQSEIKFYRRLKDKFIEISKLFEGPICDSRKS